MTQSIIDTGLSGFTVVRTSTDGYSATNGELVITDGQSVSLPDPTTNAGAVILVKPVGNDVTLTTPVGTIANQTETAVYRGRDAVWLQSDGSDWYVRSDLSTVAPDIPDSVIHYWEMGAGGGSTFEDIVGGVDASFNGSWGNDAEYGDYASFDGSATATTDSAISLDVAGNNGFTVGAAIKPDFDSSRSTNTTICRWFPESNNNWLLWWHRSQTWQWGWSNTNQNYSVGFTQGAWDTISMTVASDGSATGFFNGVQQFTDNWGSAVGSDLLDIGHDDGGSNWIGGLRNLFIADDVLSQSEIQSILQP